MKQEMNYIKLKPKRKEFSYKEISLVSNTLKIEMKKILKKKTLKELRIYLLSKIN